MEAWRRTNLRVYAATMISRGKLIIGGGGAVFAVLMLAGCLGEEGSARGGSLDPAGTWGDSSSETAPYLVLEDDGSFTGSDGCNNLTGSWSIDEADQVEFEDVASTMKACEDVDDWLAGLSVANISDDTMTVLGQDGAEIGQLERSE
jgi:heat shock protein HslJ